MNPSLLDHPGSSFNRSHGEDHFRIVPCTYNRSSMSILLTRTFYRSCIHLRMSHLH